MKNLGLCVMCCTSESKYCCPRCSAATCSLICSREHKKKKGCDGKRDPVKFVAISKFDDLTMLSDYRLLESAGRVVEACARDPMKRYTRYKEELPKHLHLLKNAVYQRGCRLKYLPQHFIRHSQNSTFLNWQTRALRWKVEWNFDQAGVQKISESLSETALVGRAVCSLLEDPELMFYKSAGIRRMRILIVAEQQKGKRKRYFECDPSVTLRGNLQGLTIIEYPIMHIVLEEHIQAYKILLRDDEEEIDLGVQGIIDSDPSASEASEDSEESSSSDESEESSSDESEDTEQPSSAKNNYDAKEEVQSVPKVNQLLSECEIKKEPDVPTLEIKIENTDYEMNDDSLKSQGVIENGAFPLIVPKVEKDSDMEEGNGSESPCKRSINEEQESKAPSKKLCSGETGMEVQPAPARALVCYNVSDSDSE